MPAATMTAGPALDVGIYGKMPAHRDFVSRGLPRVLADHWHDWLESATALSSDALKDRHGAIWAQAPCWRFAMPAGVCGASPARGVVIPSADEAGRRFPLALVVRRRDDAGAPAESADPDSEAAFFSVLETAARDAVAGRCAAGPLRERLESADLPTLAAPGPESVWRGGDAPAPCLVGSGMPPPAAFIGMLTGDWTRINLAPFKVTS